MMTGFNKLGRCERPGERDPSVFAELSAHAVVNLSMEMGAIYGTNKA